jgi:hypothetical protein
VVRGGLEPRVSGNVVMLPLNQGELALPDVILREVMKTRLTISEEQGDLVEKLEKEVNEDQKSHQAEARSVPDGAEETLIGGQNKYRKPSYC